jgi:hypothetical protein
MRRMSFWGVGLWAVGVWLGLYVVGFAITAHRLLRMRLGPLRFERCAEEALPEALRRLFQRAVEEDLAPLGFEPVALALGHGPLVSGPTTPTLWLRHSGRRVWALLGPAKNPTPSALLRLYLVTYFAEGGSLSSVSGEQWATWSKAQPDARTLDLHRVSWAEQLHDHLAALAQEPMRTGLELELDEIERRTEQGMLDALKSLPPLRAADTEAPAYGMTWRTAGKLALRALFPARELRRLRAERARLPVWEPEATQAQPWIQAQARLPCAPGQYGGGIRGNDARA